MDGKRIYTLREAAERLGVCRETVRRELLKGRLKGYKAGFHWRITKEEIDRYMGKSIS